MAHSFLGYCLQLSCHIVAPKDPLLDERMGCFYIAGVKFDLEFVVVKSSALPWVAMACCENAVFIKSRV